MSFYVRTGAGGSNPDFLISDLGYVVLTGASWTVLSVHDGLGPVDGYGQFTADEIKNSYDLYMAITDGYLEWSQDGYAQETGTYDSDVAFVKDFGNNHFDLRDGRLTIPNRQSGWVPTLAGDFFYDTDDGYLVFYDGYETKFVQLSEGGSLTAHDQLSGLLDDDHTQYLLLSGNAARNTVTGSIDLNGSLDASGGRVTLPSDTDPPANFAAPSAGEIAFDSDGGFLLFYDGASWVQLTDTNTAVTDHGALTGLGDDDHTQYLLLSGSAVRNTMSGSIDLNGTLDATGGRLALPSNVDPNLNYATPTAGEIAYDSDDGYLVFYDGYNWIQVADTTSSVTDHGALTGLLDDDHTQYALLTGGAVRNTVTGTFDFGDGYLIVPTYTSAPVTSVIDGATVFSGGVLYVYDGTRSKWLSVDRALWWVGRNATATNLYLRGPDGLASSSTGYRAMRNGTIVGLVAQTDSASTWTLEVRRNDLVAPIASLTITAAIGAQSTTTNVDISAGDEIQLYCNGTAVPQPLAGVEIAWRL